MTPADELKTIADRLATPGVTTRMLEEIEARLRALADHIAKMKTYRGVGWGL